MTPPEVFKIANTIVLPMWLLLIILPKWKITQWLITFPLFPIFLSIIYLIYIIQAVQIGGMDFGSLQSVMKLFTEENAVLAGWVHYLAFDLLVGMWLVKQNKEIGIHQVIMAIILIGTFMFGPIGFLLFTLFKTIKTSKS